MLKKSCPELFKKMFMFARDEKLIEAGKISSLLLVEGSLMTGDVRDRSV